MRNRRGFTLVELLVVIGIIAVLIGVLLPALNRARQSANAVSCMANLRSIGQAINIYVAASKGVLPFGYWDGSTPPGIGPSDVNKTSDWRALLQSVMTKQSGNTYVDSAGAGGNESSIAKQTFVCTDLPDGVGVLTYGVHPRLMPAINFKDPIFFTTGKTIWMQPYKMGRIKRAAEVLLVADASLKPLPDFGNRLQSNFGLSAIDRNAFNGGPGAPPTQLLDDYGRPGILPNYPPGSGIDVTAPTNPAATNRDSSLASDFSNWGNIRFRHKKNSTANVLMVDGHVESHTYKFIGGVPTSTLTRSNINVNAQ